MNKLKNENDIIILGRIEIDKNAHDIRKRVYSIQGMSPTICGAGRGGNSEPKIVARIEDDAGTAKYSKRDSDIRQN